MSPRVARIVRAGRPLSALALVGGLALAAARPVAADPTPPAPTGPHPRAILDDTLRQRWQAAAGKPGTAVGRAQARCAAARADRHEYDRDSYMGFDWSATLQACLVAYVAHGDEADAQTALRFFDALLDDLKVVGDKQGGELAVRRDSGYAIRGLVPAVALAYDWLHAHPGMTEARRAHARERFAQWLTWYQASGYHARTPATNYHAGYTLAVALVAVAVAGEAGPAGDGWWHLVVDELWGKDLGRALAPGGVLDGGDFPEGWQYAPLSVAEYALAWRALAPRGVRDDGVGRWLGATLVRTLHAEAGNDRVPALGDADHDQPSLPVNPMTLAAVLIGDAPPAAQRYAAAELARLHLSAKEYPLYDALAEARGAVAEAAPRAQWPTAYLTAGPGVLYARTAWTPDAIWLAEMCGHTLDADHTQPNAGNLVISRGADEVLIDPSPYGSMSSLTSNAPTVESRQLPAEYHPSQAYWSKATGFTWAVQSAGGVIASRCDYADQYKLQETPSDVPAAARELVVVPWSAGAATAIVIDRATSGDPARGLWLRFRSAGKFVAGPASPGLPAPARAEVGGSALTVRQVAASGGVAALRALPVADCFAPGVQRGKCDAARVPTGEYRLTVPGPTMLAVHALEIGAAAQAGGAPTSVTPLPEAPEVLHLRRGVAEAYVATAPRARYATPVPAVGHVAVHVLAPADAAATTTVAVTRDGETCVVTLGAPGGLPIAARPAIFRVDARCAAVEDPAVGPAAPSLGATTGPALTPSASTIAPPPRGRTGCLDVAGGPRGLVPLALIALVTARRRRTPPRPGKV